MRVLERNVLVRDRLRCIFIFFFFFYTERYVNIYFVWMIHYLGGWTEERKKRDLLLSLIISLGRKRYENNTERRDFWSRERKELRDGGWRRGLKRKKTCCRSFICDCSWLYCSISLEGTRESLKPKVYDKLITTYLLSKRWLSLVSHGAGSTASTMGADRKVDRMKNSKGPID